ncbi:ABC transporter permease subunit [Aeromicrobium terrae]|uniref:ABC transporter permease subunit n=1 Tax=Aeromicrobium terrae TaxID=2498846 RepID=UPI00164FD841|nr:branched-chain amino acid ABC transporter permease [Aeromicrobium terrae]
MRLRLAALLPLLFLLTVVGTTAPAHAANDTIDVVGTLLDNRDTPPKPVPGVKISVEESGAQIAEGVSDAEGKFSIALPGAPIDLLGKKITVKIDTDTLPEGTSLTDEKKTEYSVTIRTDGDIPIGYRIGPKADDSDELVRKVSQSAINGVFLGLLLALGALGLSLVFGTTGLTNFAHGELITFGAIVGFLLQDKLDSPFLLAALAGVVLSGVFGYANDVFLWKPLRRRGTGLLAMMIVSIGLAIFLRNVYQYIVGADSHQFTGVPLRREPWEIGSIDISPRTFWSAVICAIILVIISIAVQRTRLGKATRAVSDNPALAASSGIDVDRVILTVWIVGGALAGTSGILWGINYGFDYQFGFKILLLVFAGVTLGGLGTIWGTMAGSLIVGLMVEMSSLILPPELKYVTALVVLILVLLIRPQGILGRAQRIG